METERETEENKLLYTPLALKHGRKEDNECSADVFVSALLVYLQQAWLSSPTEGFMIKGLYVPL